MSNTIKTIAAAAATAAAITALPLTTATAQTTDNCAAVEIIVVAGTGESNSNDDPHNIQGFNAGYNYTQALDEKYGDKVSAWQVPYTASVGILGSLGESRADAPIPYGASRVQGVNTTLAHMAQVAADCPGTKFMLTGFSQGASVAGDIAAAVANGEVPGVTTADVMATYLIADPARAQLTDQPASSVTGPTGVRTADGAIYLPLDGAGMPGATDIGMTGVREGASFYDTDVISICHPLDSACSTFAGGVLQKIGQGMNEWTTPSNNHLRAAPNGLAGVDIVSLIPTQGLLNIPIIEIPQSLLQAVADGDAEEASLIARGFGNSDLTPAQRSAVAGLAMEIGVIAQAVNDATAPVPAYTGQQLAEPMSPIIDLIINDLASPNPDPKNIMNLLPYFTNLMPFHLGYLEGAEHGPWTIDGLSVDRWIGNDMDTRIAHYLDTPVEPDTGTEEPGTDEPGTDEPGTEEPGTDEPGTEEPGTDEPGTDEPGTDEPGTDEPGTDEPGTDTPVTDAPGTNEPGTNEPGTNEPGTNEPGTNEPGTNEPGTNEPGPDAPVTDEPGTEDPGTGPESDHGADAPTGIEAGEADFDTVADTTAPGTNNTPILANTGAGVTSLALAGLASLFGGTALTLRRRKH